MYIGSESCFSYDAPVCSKDVLEDALNVIPMSQSFIAFEKDSPRLLPLYGQI